MRATIKTLIFDFGNVLGFFDYKPAFQRLRALTNLSEKEIRLALDSSELPDAFETGHINAAQFLDRLVEICQIQSDCDRALLTSAWADIFTPNTEVCELIPLLKPRYRLLLGSNTNEIHAGQFRSQFAEVLSHFDELVLSYELKAMKPHRQFFQHCLERSKATPAECVFIDDLAVNIDAARASGLHGIVYLRDTDLKQQLRQLGLKW